MDVVYVTGNENKAKLFNQMIGLELEHVFADIDEIQSLNIREVIEHKARAAYAKIRRPVLVEDTTVVFVALGQLPGPLIKWFLQELKPEGLCRLVDSFDTRDVVTGAAIAYFNGETLEIFERSMKGSIAPEPAGTTGWGFDPSFIPEGSRKTHGQMTQAEYLKSYARMKPFEEVAGFLHSLDKK